jgi:CRP-like cAMP-binding protein
MHLFQRHISKFVNISDEAFAEILTFFEEEQVKKKQTLLQAGNICRHYYFVLNGCLRMFFINDKGVEETTEFAIENWWITDNFAFERQLRSEFFIQSVEASRVLQIDYATQEKLLATHPVMERYFRCIYQRAYAAAQRRIKFLYDFSKEEMFDQLNTLYPEFVQRIPQYLIASFLGFTPEYLSEIRKKKSS